MYERKSRTLRLQSGRLQHCKHCGADIVQRLGDNRWVHSFGGGERCKAKTVAEPDERLAGT
jgi:hypothetical protein